MYNVLLPIDSPTTDETATTPDDTPTTGAPSTSEFDNCEMLHTSLSLEWTVDRSFQSIDSASLCVAKTLLTVLSEYAEGRLH